MAEAAPRVEGVEAAATALTSGVLDLLIDLKCEIVEAQVYKFMRQSEDQRNEAVMRTNALVLNDVDFAGHERRLALLDEEFDRLLHRRFVGPQISRNELTIRDLIRALWRPSSLACGVASSHLLFPLVNSFHEHPTTTLCGD